MKLQDRVAQISATIQELRQASGDGRSSRQIIDSLFRIVHSFKAAASAEGLTDLSRTAHEFEDVLHALRTGKLTLNDEVLQVFDKTEVALRDGVPTSALKQLNQVTRYTPTHDNDLPAEFASLKETERTRAAAALREGANLYIMNVEFDVSDFEERFRQLKEQLEQTAELISTSPRMENDKILFQVVYASYSEKIPVQTVLRQAIFAGNQVGRELDKNVTFVVRSDEFLLEKTWADVLTDALLHLVRNAIDHGIESEGTVTIEATAKQITVTDDGRGIRPDNLPRLFQPGFSTAQKVTEYSGRGVGLDAVRAAVEQLGGSVSVTSKPGKGSSFKIQIPDQITNPNPSSGA